jgi:hypothetical protein
MDKQENGEKTDIVRLFVVLIALSAVGFGVGAAYLYSTQIATSNQFEKEAKAISMLKKIAEATENKLFWGAQPKGASRTTGADLNDYIGQKAKNNGIPMDGRNTKQKLVPSKGYKETKVTLRTQEVTLEQITRYLYNVQQGRNDVYIASLKLSSFDYEMPIPTCKATIEFLVFEEMKPASKK